jgi:DHA2 family methylenomycin A resistance protein-like MFS transporter
VFFLNLPFALAAMALAGRATPPTGRRARDVDLPGQLLGIAGLALLTWSLVRAGQAGWTSPAVLAGFVLAVAAWAGFVGVEYRATDPMLPLWLLRRPAFAAGSAVGLLINFGFYGQLFLMSLYLQDVRGYSALATGLALLPEAALLVVASTLSGRIMARTGPRRVTARAGDQAGISGGPVWPTGPRACPGPARGSAARRGGPGTAGTAGPRPPR